MFGSAKTLDKVCLHKIWNLLISYALENTKIFDNHRRQSCSKLTPSFGFSLQESDLKLYQEIMLPLRSVAYILFFHPSSHLVCSMAVAALLCQWRFHLFHLHLELHNQSINQSINLLKSLHGI